MIGYRDYMNGRQNLWTTSDSEVLRLISAVYPSVNRMSVELNARLVAEPVSRRVIDKHSFEFLLYAEFTLQTLCERVLNRESSLGMPKASMLLNKTDGRCAKGLCASYIHHGGLYSGLHAGGLRRFVHD